MCKSSSELNFETWNIEETINDYLKFFQREVIFINKNLNASN